MYIGFQIACLAQFHPDTPDLFLHEVALAVDILAVVQFDGLLPDKQFIVARQVNNAAHGAAVRERIERQDADSRPIIDGDP